MKINRLTGLQVVLVIVTMVLVGWVSGYITAMLKPITVNDMPAWIQAIFSIIAIFAAIWISQVQRRHDRKERAEMERKSIVGILVLIDRGRALAHAMGSIEEGDPSAALIHSVGVIAGKLESLDLILSPSPILLRCSLNAANYLRVASDSAQERRYGDLRRLIKSLQSCSDQITKFYGISDEDYPNGHVC